MKSKPPIPKEHGAWAMLYAPLVMAALSFGRFDLRGILFFVAVTGVFLAHEPFAALARLRPSQPNGLQRRSQARVWLAIYALIAVAATLPLLLTYDRWLLLPFGAVLLVLLLLHIWMAAKRAERKVVGELLGVISLTMTAPGAYYVIAGRFDEMSLLIWVLNLLYFASAVFYVKMRVSRYAQKPDAGLRTWQCVIYHLGLGALVFLALRWELVSSLLLLAYFPIMIRAFAGLRPQGQRLNLKRIGVAELGYTVVFIIFAVWGIYLHSPLPSPS